MISENIISQEITDDKLVITIDDKKRILFSSARGTCEEIFTINFEEFFVLQKMVMDIVAKQYKKKTCFTGQLNG